MSEWLSKLIEGTQAPVEKTVRWEGEDRTVYVRKITAAERVQLVQGQKIATRAMRDAEGESSGQTEIEVDLGSQESGKQKLIFFGICKSDGSRLFASIKDAGKLPGGLVNALARIVSEYNKDESEEEVGKG